MHRFGHSGLHQYGSAILAVLSMTTLSSIAMLVMMLSIKSHSKTLAMEKIQIRAADILYQEHEKSMISFYRDRVPSHTAIKRTVDAGGIAYTYLRYPDITKMIDRPIHGFSLQSNYASVLTSISSQLSMEIIQTPVFTSGLYCVSVRNGILNSIPQARYSLSHMDRLVNSMDYLFDSATGIIRKVTAAYSNTLIDLEFNSNQSFSRADFISMRKAGMTKIAVVFAVTNPSNSDDSLSNRLFILFDDINSAPNSANSISREDLIELENDYRSTGHEPGFTFTLQPGQLAISAITTVNEQIVFITQRLRLSDHSREQTYSNTIYLIDLAPAAKQVIDTRKLPDSSQRLELMTGLADGAEFSIGTPARPSMLTFPLPCKQIFRYEK